MSQSYNIYDTKSKPIYDEKTGKLAGWRLILLVDTHCLLSPVAYSMFFKESFFRNSYRYMCRTRNRLLKKYNENNK